MVDGLGATAAFWVLLLLLCNNNFLCIHQLSSHTLSCRSKLALAFTNSTTTSVWPLMAAFISADQPSCVKWNDLIEYMIGWAWESPTYWALHVTHLFIYSTRNTHAHFYASRRPRHTTFTSNSPPSSDGPITFEPSSLPSFTLSSSL